MDFRILGPLEVVEDGRVLDLGGQKQRMLLAVLLLRANEVVSVDALTEALWEGAPPVTASKVLQVYVSQLRKELGRDRVETRAPGYLLHVDGTELDLGRFRALRADGSHEEALALWRGPPLGEFAHQRFARPEIAQLEELQLTCREERVDADLAAGRHAELVGELEALVVEHPLRERLRAQLMLALYRAGRQAEALEEYNAARRALVDGLGIEPSRELRELHQAILNQDPALDLASAQREAEHPRGAFVGREAELDALTTGLDDAFAGHGRLVLLVGEPGIGKSRLAEELAGRARARGARILVGRCWEAGGAPAYWPWVQSLRAYVRESEPETVRRQLGAGAVDLAQLLPELRELVPGLGQPPPVEPESARFRLFEAVTELLTAAAQVRPLVLVLDDLHAADEPSLLLLRFLARELGNSRLLVIGAYRDVDPTPRNPLTATVAELAREPGTSTIALSGLDANDVRRFVELVSGEEPSDDLVAAIHGDTEGNPLFVGEIIRLLATEGHGHLEEAGRKRPPIPQSVRAVIARRLGHLSEECNRVLLLASILGREFEPRVLAELAEVGEDLVLETLDEAMEARVVSDLPGSRSRLRFAHVLIRDTLYEGLTTARRVRLHRQVVAVLETAAAADAELAYHSVAGSDFGKGLLYARRAADRALELLAYEEAARLYAMALDALELAAPHDDESRCALLLSLGEAQARAGDTPSAKRTFLAAAVAARELGLSHELAQAAAGYAGRIVWMRAGDDELLVPLLEEGLAALGDTDVVLRARLLARLGGALRDEHSRERRDALSATAVELARSSGNAAALDYALEGRAYAILGPDTIAEQLALATEIREIVPREDLERVVAALMLRADLLLGDVHGDEAILDEAQRIAEELRQPVQLWMITVSRAMVALGTGRFEEGEALMSEALDLGERAVPEGAIPHHHMQRYALARFRGGLDDVEPGIRDLVAAYPSRPVFRCALARFCAHLDRMEEARAVFDELVADGAAALPFDQEWLFGMCLLAETCAALGDAGAAATLYDLLLPWRELNVVDPAEGFMGSVSRYLGLLAALLERPDDAARHFEDAIAMNERMGARPWLAYTQHDYARLLDAREPERAAELLAGARATYRELGMVEPG